MGIREKKEISTSGSNPSLDIDKSRTFHLFIVDKVIVVVKDFFEYVVKIFTSPYFCFRMKPLRYHEKVLHGLKNRIHFVDSLNPADKKVSKVFFSLTPTEQKKIFIAYLRSTGRPISTPLSPQTLNYNELAPILKTYLGDNLEKARQILRKEQKIEKNVGSILDKQFKRAQDQKDREDVNIFFHPFKTTSSEPVTPITLQIGEKEIGVAWTQGPNDHMEDTYLASTITFRAGSNKIQANIFAVFDGHGGTDASIFAKKEMSGYLKKTLAQFNKTSLSDDGIFNGLTHAFLMVDRNFLGKDGTTATLLLEIGDDLWVANSGDSGVTLCSNGTAILLSEDAKPNLPHYKKHIENRGGMVKFIPRDKIYRAIGMSKIDGEWKPVGLGTASTLGDHLTKGKYGLKVVPPRPNIIKHQKPQTENWDVIIGSDGLYDAASREQVAKAVNLYRKKELSPTDMASNLVGAANNAGSQDNITVMVIPF